MNILGISCFYHDSAAALVRDGVLVAAAEEERFSRIKHDHGFPSDAIAFCLEQAGLRAEDLDYVVYYEKPFLKFERILSSSLSTFPRRFEVNEGEYKVMGMAPYGKPRYIEKVWKLITLGDDGSFRLNMEYFSFHYSARHTYNHRFVELMGEERPPSMHFFTRESGYPSYF